MEGRCEELGHAVEEREARVRVMVEVREGLEARLGRGGYVVGPCGMRVMWCMRCGGLGGRRWSGGLGMGRQNDWPPPGGAGHLSHTHPHLLSTPVDEAVQGLLWSLIQQLLLLL